MTLVYLHATQRQVTLTDSLHVISKQHFYSHLPLIVLNMIYTLYSIIILV